MLKIDPYTSSSTENTVDILDPAYIYVVLIALKACSAAGCSGFNVYSISSTFPHVHSSLKPISMKAFRSAAKAA